MIEKYTTIVAFILVLRGFVSFPYVHIMRRTKLRLKGRNFVLNKWFSTWNNNTWKIFWLSIIWLIVYYFDYIKDFING